MTFFGVLMVLILCAMLISGFRAKSRGVTSDGHPLPAGHNIALVLIGLFILGILTVGTGSLL